MKLARIIFRTGPTILLLLLCRAAHAQVKSGSNGSDGAFNPTTNTVINMADHPNGIYQYTSVTIPAGVSVSFIPNANNTPVVWLVQSNCVVNGNVNVNGQNGNGTIGGAGGPGGWAGGSAGGNPTAGQGPGGGGAGDDGSGGSFGTQGGANTTCPTCASAGQVYGNSFLVPILGGSGGGGSGGAYASGGGGGGILIAASGSIQLNGQITASGGNGTFPPGYGAYGTGGSGGGVRLVAPRFVGTGFVGAGGGSGRGGILNGGAGRVRIDAFENSFGGTIVGVLSQGFQPIILPTAGQGAQLNITSVGGVPVSTSPTGGIATPDAVLSAQRSTPIPIVVHCSNIPLNTQIAVSVKPANGATVSATGLNNTGTLASSTATVSINMPRGGGIIYATAATGN